MKPINADVLLNMWLKYHNLTVEDLIKKHTKEELNNPSWFNLYPVTQEQHDTWVEECKKYIKKQTGLSKKFVDRKWGYIYIDIAPNIIIN